MTQKQCQTCKAFKPLEAFPLRESKKQPHARRPHCFPCYAAHRKARRRLRSDRDARQPIALQGRDTLPRARRYVVTYAQNATPVHGAFWRSLLHYCEWHEAELVVVPGRYRNPTSRWTLAQARDEWWATQVRPHLFKGQKDLGGIVVYGDISIQPTAVRPLSGFEVYAGKDSAIFGHPKLHLETVATGRRYYPRIMTTTGACTLPNYTDSKAGKKGERHHVLGATVVEVDEKNRLFHLRQLNATDDGTFVDLTECFTPDGVWEAEPVLAIAYGDIHVDLADEDVLEATFGAEDSIQKTLRPRHQFLHDTLHFARRSKHSRHDFWDRFVRRRGDAPDDVEEEVREAVAFVDRVDADPEVATYVVGSNHDDHFDEWLLNADPRRDPQNARFFHEMWAALLRHYELHGERLPAFEMAYRLFGEGGARFLGRDETLELGGVYYHFHGDKGLSGARPGKYTYPKLGVKTARGHTHAPSIIDGCYTAGVTGRLDQGYNHTPSSWMHAHVVQYAETRKRTLIFVVDGRWRA